MSICLSVCPQCIKLTLNLYLSSNLVNTRSVYMDDENKYGMVGLDRQVNSLMEC